MRDNSRLNQLDEYEPKWNKFLIYSSHNGFRIKSEIKLSEYNCNQDLVSGKTENQIGFSISDNATENEVGSLLQI